MTSAADILASARRVVVKVGSALLVDPASGAVNRAWLRVGAVIGLLSIAAQSLVEFSLQMPGNAALFALLAGIALHQSPNLRDRSTSA